MPRLLKNILLYFGVLVVGVFLSSGGPQPDIQANQKGDTITTRFYGQPFNFYQSGTYKSADGKSSRVADTTFGRGEIAAMVTDIVFWSLLVWIVVQLALGRRLLPALKQRSQPVELQHG